MATIKTEELDNDCLCPICNETFSLAVIEIHADGCIISSSANDTSVTVKRPSNERLTQEAKRAKVDVACNSGEIVDIEEEAKALQPRLLEKFNASIPLAERMRPSELTQFIGQEHVLGHNKILRNLLEKRDIPSMIFWGPPGCGKTTLGCIIATQCQQQKQIVRFTQLSATMAGINDVKDVIKKAVNDMKMFKRKTILFMDEIHRFNKLQQDVFLPHVESGLLTLIGATTENPSFSLNSSLLSRCKVIVLEKLHPEQLVTILGRALDTISACIIEKGQTVTAEQIDNSSIIIEQESIQWLADMCDGDARIALNSLQLSVQSKAVDPNLGIARIGVADVREGVKRSHLTYDKKGDQHYDIISAVHKSIRASDDNAALYWVTRMIEGGEDPRFIARRLVRAASEDVGLADPHALPFAISVMQGCQLLGMPESDVLLAQCAVYLARAPKSREVEDALSRAKECIAHHQGPHPSVPLHLRNAPTRLMRELGYGKGYNMNQKKDSGLQYMPEGLEFTEFFDK